MTNNWNEVENQADPNCPRVRGQEGMSTRLADKHGHSVVILMADDDEDDLMMTKDAFDENKFANDVFYVNDGEQMMDFLHHRGAYADPASSPRPGLILLDLNMPRKDGREVLQDIKADLILRRIPVIVLTTSQAEEDILSTYDLGANSFITKPVTFEGLVKVVKELGNYWFNLVQLPTDTKR